MQKKLKRVLEQYKNGKKSLDDILAFLRNISFQDLGFAKVDHHRVFRRGFPEIIFCEGKTPKQIVGICRAIVKKGNLLLGTRLSPDVYKKISTSLKMIKYHDLARIITFLPKGYKIQKHRGTIAIITAGTADLPVAEEAAVTAEIMGNNVKRIYDVGVAGIHRLLAHQKDIFHASVLVVVAGMDAALLSVVGGMASCPVIGVPTSVGYGSSFGGLSSLLAMLNSCASGATVVNIDNGFGAAYAATLMNR
ncbi:MAG: nickel pincer cofactor biosynthesis protein LarB [Elusimicrobiota bacterium]